MTGGELVVKLCEVKGKDRQDRRLYRRRAPVDARYGRCGRRASWRERTQAGQAWRVSDRYAIWQQGNLKRQMQMRQKDYKPSIILMYS